MTSVDDLEDGSPLASDLMNAVAAYLGTFGPVAGAGDSISYSAPQFWSARRQAGAFRVAVQAEYSAESAIGIMTLTCWVHDEETPAFQPGSGIRRVTGMVEDPELAHFTDNRAVPEARN